MGLKSETFGEFGIFGMGMTVAIFQAEGMLPELRLMFSKYVNLSINIIMASLISLPLIPLIPLDL